MKKIEMEKYLAEYLDERWWIANHSGSEQITMVNDAYYRGVLGAIAQIGCYERLDNGTHIVSLDFSRNK